LRRYDVTSFMLAAQALGVPRCRSALGVSLFLVVRRHFGLGGR